MRIAAPLAVVLVLVPAAASAKLVNLRCTDAGGSAILVRVDTDAKVVQFAGGSQPQNWHFLSGVSVTDSAFSGTIPVDGGGRRQLDIDRASGVLQVDTAAGGRVQANCALTTLPNLF